MDFIIILLGIVLGVVGTIVIKKIFYLKGQKRIVGPQVYSFVENMKSVGELVVFKTFIKEIVTSADHWFGEWGKRYLQWLVTNKKMAMVFQFEISFWYDLRNSGFTAMESGEDNFNITMPPCLYDISIKNISFYDEQKAKPFNWLLPGLLSEALGKSPDENDKNKLMDEALKQGSWMADQLTKRLSSEVRTSAQQTMEMLAKSFGAKAVSLDFSKSELLERSVVDVSPKQLSEP